MVRSRGERVTYGDRSRAHQLAEGKRNSEVNGGREGEDGGTDGQLRTPNVSFSPTPHLPPPPASPVSNNGLIISKMLRAEIGKVPSALSRDISNSRLPAAGEEKVKDHSYRSIE